MGVRALFRPDDGGGELSTERGYGGGGATTFRRLQGLSQKNGARMSIRGLGGSSQWVWPAKRELEVLCPRAARRRKVVGAAATACSGDWSAWSCSASARLISWLRVEAIAGVNWDLVVGRRRVAPAEQW